MDTERGVSDGAVPLPAGLAQMAPGPQLAAVLAAVDRTRVPNAELADLVVARARLLAHVHAQLLADLWEAAQGVLAGPQEGALARCSTEAVIELAANPVAWSLHWSSRYASGQIQLGRALTQRLPMVLDALTAGRIDHAKAFAFVDGLSGVADDEVARSIATKLLRRAGEQTLGELRDKLRYHVDRADPGSARRRYRSGVAQRTVFVRANTDGTANLCGLRLPPHRAAAAFDRLDRIARHARAAGDERNLGQLRADALTDLLAGLPFQTAPAVDPVSAQADATEAPDGYQRRPPAWSVADPAPPRRADVEPEPEPVDRIDLYDYDRHCLTDEDLAWVNSDPPPSTGTDTSRRPTAEAGARGGAAVASTPVVAGDRCVCGGRIRPRPGVVELQVKLTTLAGLDDDPAVIAGLGPTLPEVARRVAADPGLRAVWRWSIFDHDGELLHHGLTRQRPDGLRSPIRGPAGGQEDSESVWCTCPRLEPGARRSTVEVQLTLATLVALTNDPRRAPEWQAVLADIAGQVAADRTGRPLDDGRSRRMPDPVEDAFIRARDRSCRAPHCRRIASRCELDHRVEYAKGGPSHRGNVDALCCPHHDLKDLHGMRIEKSGSITIWTLPNGQTFTVDHVKDIIVAVEE